MSTPTVAADPAAAPELPLEAPLQTGEEAELRAAWESTKGHYRRRVRRLSFEEAMADPLISLCVKNIAHARRQKRSAGS